MISYITSYEPRQLIGSAEELVRRPDIHLLVEKGLNVEMILKVNYLFEYIQSLQF